MWPHITQPNDVNKCILLLNGPLCSQTARVRGGKRVFRPSLRAGGAKADNYCMMNQKWLSVRANRGGRPPLAERVPL